MKVSSYKSDWSKDPLVFFHHIHEHISSGTGEIMVEVAVLETILDRISKVFKINLTFLTTLKIGLDILKSSTFYKHKNILVKFSELFKTNIELHPKISTISNKIDYLYQLTQDHINTWKEHLRFQLKKVYNEHINKKGDITSKLIKKLILNKEFKQDAADLLKSFYYKNGNSVQKFDHFVKLTEVTIQKYFGKNFQAEQLMPFFEAVYIVGENHTVNFIMLWDDLKEEEIREFYKGDQINSKLYWFITISSPMILFVKK